MRLHQCSICDHVDAWSEKWSIYSSLALGESAPYLVPRLCSKQCADVFQKGLDEATIILPKINSKNGNISMPQQGYKGQPNEDEVLRLYNVERAVIKNTQSVATTP